MENIHTTQFMDSGPQWTTSLKNSSDSTRLRPTDGGDDTFADFFSRPIISSVTSWVPSSVTALSIIINPWDEFFNNARVANRLNNFTLLSCTLKVKFMLNGNSFYYGRAMVDYAPGQVYDEVSSFATLPLDNVVGASQRMHLYLDPTTSQGGEMTLPFTWHYDALRINTNEWVSMGQIYVREVVPLKHANAATTPVEVSYSIWAEDVVLSMPTTVDISGLVAQAKITSIKKGDEYGTSPVSVVASTVASAAGLLSNIPGIRMFAKATQMVASTVGSIAKLYGYSRPAQIEPITMVRPTYNGSIAVTDVSDPVTKLTVTSKQELSIDPRICGADLGDELCLSRLAAIESFVTQFPWTVASTPGSLLFNTRVSPNMCRFTTPYYFMPACMFVTRPFRFWRGIMRYRIQIVASAFHKGRLRIVYDPNYINSLEANVGFTRIVDLDVERDIVVDVEWGQPQQFLPCYTMANSATSYSNTTAFNSSSINANGVLGVYVLNTLTTPNSTANNDITVNVFVSMLDGEFASPISTDIDTLANVYQYTPQSAELDVSSRDANAPAIDDCTTCISGQEQSDNMYDVYFGEKITSFRQLLKRYMFHSSYVYLTGSATNPIVHTSNIPDFPQYRGYSVTAIHTPTAPGKYNYMNGTLLHYLTPAFFAVRGSHRSKYYARSSNESDITHFALTRGTGSSYSTASTTVPITSVSTYAKGATTLMRGTFNGAAFTAVQKQPVLEVEFPYYKQERFNYAKNVSHGATGVAIGNSIHTVRMTTTGTTTKYLDRYISVGEDFSLFWFQGAPPMAVLGDPA